MTTYTSAQSGSWSSSSTWNPTGVPGNGDTVTIQSGHIVVFDADQSSLATGLASLKIDGTLTFKKDTRTYLKVAGDITGTGKLEIGTRSDPIQRSASPTTPTATVYLNGNYYAIRTNTLEAVGWTPSTHRTVLAANAAAGTNQVVLEEDMDLQAGDKIIIGARSCDGPFNSGAESAQGLFTVQSYNRDTRTVTLTGNLGYAREAGDFVSYYDQTVQVLKTSATGTVRPNSVYMEGVFSNTSFTSAGMVNRPLDPSGVLMENSTLHGQYGRIMLPVSRLSAGRGKMRNISFYMANPLGGYLTIEDSVFLHGGHGVTGGLGGLYNVRIRDSWIGNIANLGGVRDAYSTPAAGKLMILDGCRLKGTPYFGNVGHSRILAKNMDIPSITPGSPEVVLEDCSILAISFLGGYLHLQGTIVSRNHNRTPGAWRLYNGAGSLQKVTDITPPGRSESIQATHINPDGYLTHGAPVGLLEPGEVLRASAWLRKNKTTAEMPYTPRLQILRNGNPYESLDDEFVVAEKAMDPSKVNEWDYVAIEYENTDDLASEYSVRVKTSGSAGGSTWHTLSWVVVNRATIFMIR